MLEGKRGGLAHSVPSTRRGCASIGVCTAGDLCLPSPATDELTAIFSGEAPATSCVRCRCVFRKENSVGLCWPRSDVRCMLVNSMGSLSGRQSLSGPTACPPGGRMDRQWESIATVIRRSDEQIRLHCVEFGPTRAPKSLTWFCAVGMCWPRSGVRCMLSQFDGELKQVDNRRWDSDHLPTRQADGLDKVRRLQWQSGGAMSKDVSIALNSCQHVVCFAFVFVVPLVIYSYVAGHAWVFLLLSRHSCCFALREARRWLVHLGVVHVKCVSGDWCVRACRIPAWAATASRACLLSDWLRCYCIGPLSVILCWIPIMMVLRRLSCPVFAQCCYSTRRCGAGWTRKHPLCFVILALCLCECLVGRPMTMCSISRMRKIERLRGLGL